MYEYSGTFSKLYKCAGYSAVQIDKQIDGCDCRLLTKRYKNVVGILAFPPCTQRAQLEGRIGIFNNVFLNKRLRTKGFIASAIINFRNR